MKAIEEIDAQRKVLYSPEMAIFFRLCSTAGACAIWLNGSWQDLTCFGAMAFGRVSGILQGFRIVYAIIKIMSKHTVAGGADFLEGILFTGLIAYFLKFGQYAVMSIMAVPDKTAFRECKDGIDPLWYLLFLPLSAFSWSALFMPNYEDIPLMGWQGILAFLVNRSIALTFPSETFNNFVTFLVNRSIALTFPSETFNNFVTSMCVTLSAGMISWFTIFRNLLTSTSTNYHVTHLH
jgi:uncharacterized membrane protein YjjP (DUF1212 family)